MARRVFRVSRLFVAAGLLAALAGSGPGCAAVPAPEARRQTALATAAGQGLAPIPVPGADLPVLLLGRPGPGAELVVYIEGDGLAYLDRATPSPDATPVRPLALELAGLDPAPKLAYLGRPCQYAAPLPAACGQVLWTTARFGPEAVAAQNAALDAAKAALGADRLHLVGFSGGGAMAVLLAARRDDVASLVTVAGNLDIAAFTAWHHVSPLSGSANPLDAAPAVARLPQAHISGGEDRICPPFLAQAFADRQGRPPWVRLLVLPGVSHHQGWTEAWPGLLERIHRENPATAPGCAPPADPARGTSPVLPAGIKRNS